MSTLSGPQLVARLQWRYATKRFDAARKIPAADWAALEAALVLTPSSFGLQPWKFVVITDQPTKEKLVPVSWNQGQPAECSHHVVFAVRTKLGEAEIDAYLDSIIAARGVARESLAGFCGMMTGFANKPGLDVRAWATFQAYIALGNFMTSAAVMGIDTCPMEGIEPGRYDEILGLDKTGFATVVACAAGYRADGDKYAALKKVRFPKEQVITRI
ncbi:MAG: NAD(P)H-dependent oxidoreductase [Verrucomicrobia bacterium]|nr:NAD(P)H-dependent oxidoreductase [Verrucomicrobiota bacterium]